MVDVFHLQIIVRLKIYKTYCKSCSLTKIGSEIDDGLIRVLYVDDEPALLELGKLFLEMQGGLKVTVIEKPSKALDLLDEQDFDVVLSDYEMPVINGIELLKRLRMDGNEIPFIIFTGRGREDVVIEALNNGADFYLQKGGDPKSQFLELSSKIAVAHRMRLADFAMKKQSAMDASLDGMALFDRDMILIYANQTLATIFDFDRPEDLKGIVWRSLFPPDEAIRIKQEVSPKLRNGNSYEGKSIGLRSGDERFPMELKVSRTKDGDVMVGIKDLTEVLKTQETVIQREKLLSCLADVTDSFINADHDNHGSVINNALEAMGSIIGVDRAYIFDYDFVAGVTNNTYEWCAKGISPQMEELQGIQLETIPDWVDTHKLGLPLFIDDVELLPEGRVKEILTPQGVRSLLTIPIFHDECIGFVGFDSVSDVHIYTEVECDILGMFANMLSNLRIRLTQQREIEINNRRLSMAQRFAHVGTWAYDMDTKHLYWSEECERLFGLNRGDFGGTFQDFLSFVHPEDLEHVKSVNAPITELDEGIELSYEHRIVRKDGEVRWFKEVAGVVPGKKDNSDSVVGLAIDIQDQRMGEEELARNNEFLDMVLSNVPAVVYSYTAKGDGSVEINYVNSNVSRVLGHLPEDFIGNHEFWLECLHPEDLSILKGIDEPIDVERTYRFKAKDGRYHWLKDTQRVVRNDDGGKYVVGAWLDVTEEVDGLSKTSPRQSG